MPKAIHIKKSLVEETLASIPQQGKRELEPLKSFSLEHRVPVQILEDVEVDNPSEVHEHEADLWICLSGEVMFTCGDDEFVLHDGDILYIPAGVPHAHRTKGTARLYIIKIPKK